MSTSASAVVSHSWASDTGLVNVQLLQATPKPDGTDGETGEAIDVDSNVAKILVGSGMAAYTAPPSTSAASGKMFKTGSTTPYVPAPTSAAGAPAPAKT